MGSKRFLVVGGDAAGMSAASRAKRRRPDLEVEVFEKGRYVSYGACGIPYFIAGEIPELEDLIVLTPEQFEQERGVKVNLWHEVVRLEVEKKLVVVKNLAQGGIREAAFDDLLLATGAEPVTPSGVDFSLPGVFALRNLDDARRIKEFLNASSPRKGLIVGAGYIGVEMAEGLSKAGLEMSMVVRGPRVMSIMEEEVSEAVAGELERHEVKVVTRAEVTEIEVREGALAVSLSNGQRSFFDLVLCGVGVQPRSGLAAAAGLELGVKGAVKVDRRQRTSAPGVWSAGDCCEAYHRLLNKNAYVPLALTANRQGRVVGDNVAGIDKEFPGILGTTVSKVFDLTVARTGLSLQEARGHGLEAVKVVVSGGSRAHYYPDAALIKTVVVVEKGTKKPWGVQMVGRDGVAQRIDVWATALSAGLSLEQIHDLDLAYAPPYGPVWDPVLVASQVALKKAS